MDDNKRSKFLYIQKDDFNDKFGWYINENIVFSSLKTWITQISFMTNWYTGDQAL